MNIGILTFHYAHNYGAMLQAYALLTLLREWGHDARLIDYRSPFIDYIYQKYSFRQLYSMFYQYNGPAVSLIRALAKYRGQDRKISSERWRRFETFSTEYLPKTERVTDIASSHITDGMDAIICGSDQIWNKRIAKKSMPVFFCNGFGNSCRKIAYAASAGDGSIAAKDTAGFVRLCSNMDSISVREEALAGFLRTNGIECSVVLDPVFMIGKDGWSRIAIMPEKQGYILTYSFGLPEVYFQMAREKAAQTGREVVTLPSDCGPREFLGYFLNASLIVTNSFHGTAFSILLGKQFLTFLPRYGVERITSLLTTTGLCGRVITPDSDPGAIPDTDFTYAASRIEEMRTASVNFLQTALNKPVR